MPISKAGKTDLKKAVKKDRAADIVNTFDWLINVFISVLLLIGFVTQSFVIPTGSMADTLRGAHFRLRCPQCGYKYEYGIDSRRYGLPQNTLPHGNVRSYYSRCPSCGCYQPTGGTMPISGGDRILVLKWPYQFFEPRHWDVVVFKNPLNPAENYIKRLAGRPGETVEIIDGDVYIDGKISRKPPNVQDEMWMPVYDNDYQPVRPTEGRFNGHIWQQPFRNVENSKWTISKDNPAVFCLNRPTGQINTMIYDTSAGNDFRATYAYDEVERYAYLPYCSDLMVRFYADSNTMEGSVGVSLSKYQTSYKALVNLSGEMVIAKITGDKEEELVRKSIKVMAGNKPTLVKFANIDHQLIFEFGGEKIDCNLGCEPNDAGPRKTEIQPVVKIFGAGKLAFSHIAIFRDIHYTAFNGGSPMRATEGNPLKLEKNEFFVLGDNSPNSEDGRLWKEKGKGNNGLFYREGIVPRDYLVGKAFFVTWPAGYKPFAEFPFSIIPDVSRIRLIYGSSGKSQ